MHAVIGTIRIYSLHTVIRSSALTNFLVFRLLLAMFVTYSSNFFHLTKLCNVILHISNVRLSYFEASYVHILHICTTWEVEWGAGGQSSSLNFS